MADFLVRAVLTPSASAITYAVSVSGASCNEGAVSPSITITRDLHGLPAQDSSIRFRTLNATEFAAQFPGQTQALAADFTEGYADTPTSPLRVACAAAGISVVHVGGQYDQLIWTSASSPAVSFTRNTINDPADTPDKRSAYTLTDPSVGTISAAVASFLIIDTFTAPPALVLLDPGMVYTPYRTSAVPGETVYWVEKSAGTIASATMTNSASGKFALGAPVAGRYPVQTTTTAADFEGLPDATGYTVGASHEVVSVRAIGTLGDVVDQNVNVWPNFPQISVTGGDAYTPTPYTDATGVQNSQNSSTGNKRVRYPTPGIYKFPSGANLRRENGSNVTFEAQRGVVERAGRGTETQAGTNKLYRNRTFRAGAHAVTELGMSASNVDNFVIGQTTGPVERIKFENCSFSLSWDELGSVINVAGLGPYVRGIWFHNCFFHSPLIDQRDGISHHYGPIIGYEKTMWVVETFCVHASCAMRSPFIGKARGILLQNNVIYYRSTNTNGHSGITIKADNSLQNNQDISIIIRGNLLKCEENLTQATGRSMAIGAQALGTGSYIQAHFGDPPRENHFFQHAAGTPTFTNDPLILASHVMKQVGTTVTTSFVNFDPFTGAAYDYMPTSTPTERLALWNRCMDYCGNRARAGDPYTGALIPGDSALDRYDYNAIQNLRNVGHRSGPFYAAVDTEYGVAWDGVGGSLGYAMNAVPPAAAGASTVVTDLMGPMLEKTATIALGAEYSAWETEFNTVADAQWSTNGAAWDTNQQNFYDRSAIYRMQWWRYRNDDPTRAAVFDDRADQMAINYRDNYLSPSFAPAPLQSQIMGVAMHALLKSNGASLLAVGRVANFFSSSAYLTYYGVASQADGRDQSRLVESILAAWYCSAPPRTPTAWATATSYIVDYDSGGVSTVTQGGFAYACAVAHTSGVFATDLAAGKWKTLPTFWRDRLDTFLNAFLTTTAGQGKAWPGRTTNNGAWRFGVQDYYTKPFMDGLWMDVLIKTMRLFPSGLPNVTTARMGGIVKDCADYMWANIWSTADQAFWYMERPGSASEGAAIAPDLNNMLGHAWGWLYNQGVGTSYRTNGEAIFNGTSIGGISGGTFGKQFNERYRFAFPWLTWRDATPGGGMGGGASTLNPSDKSTVTLSGGDLIATSGAASNQGVRSINAITGKKYFEFKNTTESGTNQNNCGIAGSSFTLTASPVAASVAAAVAVIGGASNAVIVRGTSLVSLGYVGDANNQFFIGVAVDRDTNKLWMRAMNAAGAWDGNWNGATTASQNPVTGTGGLDISLITGAIHAFAGFTVSADALTANFGGTAYQQAAPSGFGNL